MEIAPGSYWDRRKAGTTPGRFRVVRLIPADDGHHVYAQDVVTGTAVVARWDRWTARYVRAI